MSDINRLDQVVYLSTARTRTCLEVAKMTQNPPNSNPFGVASASIGAASLIVCSMAMAHLNTIPESMPVFALLDFFANMFFMVGGLLICGTLAAVGAILGIAGLVQRPRAGAVFGISSSLLAPSALYLNLTLVGG